MITDQVIHPAEFTLSLDKNGGQTLLSPWNYD